MQAFPSKKLRKAIKKCKWIEWSPGNHQRTIIVKTNKGKIELREFRTFCMDCKSDRPEFFMVTEEVWKEAGFKNPNDGIICVFCFKRRLNRPLKTEDFTLNKINDVVHALG